MATPRLWRNYKQNRVLPASHRRDRSWRHLERQFFESKNHWTNTTGRPAPRQVAFSSFCGSVDWLECAKPNCRLDCPVLEWKSPSHEDRSCSLRTLRRSPGAVSLLLECRLFLILSFKKIFNLIITFLVNSKLHIKWNKWRIVTLGQFTLHSP